MTAPSHDALTADEREWMDAADKYACAYGSYSDMRGKASGLLMEQRAIIERLLEQTQVWHDIASAPKDKTLIVYAPWCEAVVIGRNYSANRVRNAKPGWHLQWTPIGAPFLINGEPSHWCPLPDGPAPPTPVKEG